MLQVEMSASIRKDSGKGAMRRLRMEGNTPAVVYGKGIENVNLMLETQPFFQQLLKVYRNNALISLKLDDGSERNVILKEVQTDPVRDTLVHADFLEIDLELARQFSVPISYVGKAQGSDLGGIVNIIQESVEIQGKPLNIPDNFEIDITEMNIGDAITAGSLDIPEGAVLITEESALCITIVKPGAAEEEEVDEEGAEEEAEASAADGEAASETQE